MIIGDNLCESSFEPPVAEPVAPLSSPTFRTAILDTSRVNLQKPYMTDGVSKTDEFSEKFQTAIDPPLIFGKSYSRFRDKSAYVHYGGNVIT